MAELSFTDSYKEDSKAKERTAPAHGGGIRGRVKGFSRASRRNFLRRLARINRGVLRASRERSFFITLTFPSTYPEDPEACKEHFSAFRKRLTRRYGKIPGYWRLGVQQRGAFHLHLLWFLPRSTYGSIEELRRFVASSWYEVCGEVSEEHLFAGTGVEAVKTWRKVTSYAERYLAKPEQFREGVVTGRNWGVWNEELLPVHWETMKVSVTDAYKIRRAFRRLAGMKGSGSLRCVTVFVRHENVVRLLRFLGYREDEGTGPEYSAYSTPRDGPGGRRIVNAAM